MSSVFHVVPSVVYSIVRVEPDGTEVGAIAVASNAFQYADAGSCGSVMTMAFGRTELDPAGVCADSCTRLVPPGMSVPGETVLSRLMSTSGK